MYKHELFYFNFFKFGLSQFNIVLTKQSYYNYFTIIYQ